MACALLALLRMALHAHPCAAGSFAPQPGAASCQACQPGFYAPVPAAVLCSICDAGSSSNVSASSCYTCPQVIFSVFSQDTVHFLVACISTSPVITGDIQPVFWLSCLSELPSRNIINRNWGCIKRKLCTLQSGGLTCDHSVIALCPTITSMFLIKVFFPLKQNLH